MNNQLVKRDLQLMQIDEAIREKRNLIVQKKNDIKKKATVNAYLEGVNNDYQRFYITQLNRNKKNTRRWHC